MALKGANLNTAITVGSFAANQLNIMEGYKRNNKLWEKGIPPPILDTPLHIDSNVNVNKELNSVDRSMAQFSSDVSERGAGNPATQAKIFDAMLKTNMAKSDIYAKRDTAKRGLRNSERVENARVGAMNTAKRNRHEQDKYDLWVKTHVTNPAGLGAASINNMTSTADRFAMDNYQNQQIAMTAMTNPESIPALIATGQLDKAVARYGSTEAGLALMIKQVQSNPGTTYSDAAKGLIAQYERRYGTYTE